MQEIASLHVMIPDACLEEERVVTLAGTADLAHVPEPLKYPPGAGQDQHDRITAAAGLGHDRAAEHDILGEHRDGAGHVPGFDRGAKWVHGFFFR